MVHGTNKHTKKSRFSVKYIKITTTKKGLPPLKA